MSQKGMKFFRLFCMICFGVLALRGAQGLDIDDIARAASRTNSPGTNTAVSRSAPVSANVPQKNTTARSETTAAVRNATRATNVRDTSGKSVTARTTNSQPVSVAPRTGISTVSQRANTATYSRSNARTATSVRNTKPLTQSGRTAVRAATVNESGALVTNYKRCREIYYECMDEFCATKDANLRRCACSSRYNEFEGIKKQMTRIEDKMLDFNQRLLLVNMDPEDVKVVNTSTEGEDAFYATNDNSKSKRALDDIAKKLNAKFGESDSGTGLSALSWSLNLDSAFDTIDSIGGTDTTAKSGPALYAAATPICREIAAEVCDNDELSLAIGGYQMLIEQDCNTVYKSYQTQADTARTKVFESGALLDMSRLDAYQQKNSDDILTCKRKMLDMLTNSTVCGTDLQQCLDMTGKYIDPTTGTAFLTLNLADLDNLIIRPGQNQTWTSANSGSAFVKYLNNKKQYLEPAMANCVDIADTVWDEFIEDALSQIKLAQTSKLEEIRRACTTLTSECLTSSSDSINEFDTRALSVFGVAANRTKNAMCGDVRNSCAALIDSDGVSSWESGVSEIATIQTFETILSSCTQVGRNCIIQACKSISGNFELCDDMDFSANRHAILERTACWPDVMACVAAAGNDALVDIITTLGNPRTGRYPYSFYHDLYKTVAPIDDLCSGVCSNTLTPECAKCRITERIWGNCETDPSTAITGVAPDASDPDSTTSHNHIRMPRSTDVSTLLSWFAINTGTANSTTNTSLDRSCINTRCTTNNYATNMFRDRICLSEAASADRTDDGLYCPTGVGNTMQIRNNLTNCCYSASGNTWGHIPLGNTACCETGNVINNICLPHDTEEYKIKLKRSDDSNYLIICIGDESEGEPSGTNADYPNGTKLKCPNGRFVLVSLNDNLYRAITSDTIDENTPQMVYYGGNDSGHNNPQPATGTNAWFIRYGN